MKIPDAMMSIFWNVRKTAGAGVHSNSHKTTKSFAEDTRTRWNGGVPVRRTSLTKRRYPLPGVPGQSKLNSAQVKDHARRWQKSNAQFQRMPIMMKSSSPSPSIRKPSNQYFPQYSRQSTGSRFRDASVAERKLTKRSRIHVHRDLSCDAASYKLMSQKGKESNRMKLDCPTCHKSLETARGSYKQKSPKKAKRTAVLPKSKKTCGHKNRRKMRKKYKEKGKDRNKTKTSTHQEEEEAVDNDGLGEHVLHFPEPCRAVRLPSSVWEAPKLSSHTGSFTIKRTATPVLSSLFGQGAFRTCWPQSAQTTHPTNEHDNENTGRHNTNFLGPKAQDSNNETTETVNSTKINNNIIWNKAIWNNNSMQRHIFKTDSKKSNAIIIKNVLMPQNSTFSFPNGDSKEEFRETQVLKNIRIQSTNKLQNSWESEGIKDCFQSVEVENSLQFFASYSGNGHNMDLNKSNKQQFVSLPPQGDDIEEASIDVKTPMQSLKLTNKDSAQITDTSECQRRASIQCPRLHLSGQKSNYNETTPYVGRVHDSEKRFPNRYADTKSRGEDSVRRHHRHDQECNRQLPPVSLCSVDILGTSSNDRTAGEKQAMLQGQNGQTRISSVVPGAPQAAASLKVIDKPSTYESQGCHTVWRTTNVSKDGNVFRVTRNNNVPLLRHRNHSFTWHESAQLRAKPSLVQGKSHTLKDVQGKFHTLKDVQDKSHTLKDVQGKSHTLKDVQDKSHTLKDVQGKSHTLKDVQGKSHTLKDVRGKCHTVKGVQGKSHTLKDVQGKSHTLKDVQKEFEDCPSFCLTYPKNEVSFPGDATSNKSIGLKCCRLTNTSHVQHNFRPLSEGSPLNGEGLEAEDINLSTNTKYDRSARTAGNHTWDYKNLSSSKAPKRHQPAAQTQPSHLQEDSSEQLFLGRLKKSNSFVSSTGNEFSDAASDIVSRKDQRGWEKTTNDMSGTSFDNASTSAGHSAEKGFSFFYPTNSSVLPRVTERNVSKEQSTRHALKVSEHKATKKLPGKVNIFRGHTVKKTKSLISLRNMLQELTSQVRGTQHGNPYKLTARGRKPRVKTVLYFKPVRRFRKQSFNNEQLHHEYHQKPQYFPLLKSNYTVSSFETSDSYETNEDYVNCLRLRRIKAHRHEPYSKRTSTSSCSTNEQFNSNYWTRNKNNCSPSRTGRYVLGPLVDKHVFEDVKNPLGENIIQTSSSTVTPLQDIHKVQQSGPGNRIAGFTAAQHPLKRHFNTDHRTQKRGIQRRSEERNDYKDISNISNITDKNSSLTPAVEEPRSGLRNKSKDHIARGYAAADQFQEDKGKLYIEQNNLNVGKISERPTNLHLGQTERDHSQGIHTCRRSVIRRQTAVGSSGQTEARYIITRQPDPACPAPGQNTKQTDSDISAGFGHVGQTPIGTTIQDRPVGQSKGHTSAGYGSARYTSAEFRNIGHAILRQAAKRHVNTELRTTGDTGFEHAYTINTFAQTHGTGDADLEHATARCSTGTNNILRVDYGYEDNTPTAVGTKSIGLTKPGDTFTKATNVNTKITVQTDPGIVVKSNATFETKVAGNTDLVNTTTRHTHADLGNAAENPDHKYMYTKHSEIKNGQLGHVHSCCSNIPLDSSSKQDQSTDTIAADLCPEQVVPTAEKVAERDSAEKTNVECQSTRNTPSVKQHSIEPKTQIATRAKANRLQYNRISLVKSQTGQTRLRGIRRQQSFKNASSAQLENTFPFKDRLRIRDRSVFVHSVLRSTGRGGKLLQSFPTTESHMTQTESLMNTVHVGVQTSPYLQNSPRKTSLKCNVKKCIINAKRLRHKGKQKEHVLSRYRHLRKQNRDSVDTPFSSAETFRLRGQENDTSIGMEYSISAELKSADQNKDNPSSNAKLVPTTDDGQTVEKTRINSSKRDNQQFLDLREPNQKSLVSNVNSGNEVDSKNGFGLIPQVHHEQSSRKINRTWAEKQKERADKCSNKRGKDATCNRMTPRENQRDEKTLADFPSQTKCETHEHVDCDKNQRTVSHLGASDNRKSNSTLQTQKSSNKLIKSDEADTGTKETHIASTWSSRSEIVEPTDSNCVSDRFSDLRKLCVIRPVWKNAKVEEIDRRVSRALRLREELKQNASSGEQARSLIASYFETSSATAAVTGTGWVSSVNSSTGVSDFQSTHKSSVQDLGIETEPFHDAGSDNTICHTGDQTAGASPRNSSLESEHTAQDDGESVFQLDGAATEAVANSRHLQWSSTDFWTSSGTTPNPTGRKRSSENEAHGSRVMHSVSVHEMTVSEITRGPERPPSGHTSSQPSNNSSVNSKQQTGRRNKNSPPTKISKVENISTNTPRLVDALVQKLPQVPLSSFVEWFIETSDPNNFVSSDRSGSSSDNSQSTSASFVPLPTSSANEHASSTVRPDSFNNEQSTRKETCNRTALKRAVGVSSTKKAKIGETKANSQIDQLNKAEKAKQHYAKRETSSDTWTSNLTQSFESVVPCTPTSTSYALSCSSEGVDKESVLEMDRETINKVQVHSIDDGDKACILKLASKSSLINKPSTKLVKGVCSKFSFNKKSSDSLSFRKGSTKHTKLHKYDLTRQSSFSTRRHNNERIDDMATTDKSIGQTDKSTRCGTHYERDSYMDNSDLSHLTIKYQSQSAEAMSFRQGVLTSKSEQQGDIYNYLSNKCKGKASPDLEITADKNRASNNPDNVSSLESIGHQGCISASLSKETNDNSRCAPGIRHILMKLRQTADAEDPAVGRSDRMKITLRKSSEVTGIIAKFQNK